MVYPELIFLINFSDSEYAAIEFHLNLFRKRYLRDQIDKSEEGQESVHRLISLEKVAHSEGTVNLSKRAEVFIKGGAFSITYKQLVLDLLTRRVSPTAISGFIINNAHKISGERLQSETFLVRLLKKQNPTAFIKAFTCNSQALGKDWCQSRIENLMKNLHVTNLVLYPRHRNLIKKSLDDLASLKYKDHQLEFTQSVASIHQDLIKLMQECLEELKREFKKLKSLDSTSIENEVL